MSKDKSRTARHHPDDVGDSKDNSDRPAIRLHKTRPGVIVVSGAALKEKSESDSNVKVFFGTGRDKDGKMLVKEFKTPK